MGFWMTKTQYAISAYSLIAFLRNPRFVTLADANKLTRSEKRGGQVGAVQYSSFHSHRPVKKPSKTALLPQVPGCPAPPLPVLLLPVNP